MKSFLDRCCAVAVEVPRELQRWQNSRTELAGVVEGLKGVGVVVPRAERRTVRMPHSKEAMGRAWEEAKVVKMLPRLVEVVDEPEAEPEH